MDISKSIFGLAKNNNGFFKSEKQAKFLIQVLEERGGHVGQANSGYNQCSMFATWDEKGILEITKHRSTGKLEVMFQRKEEGVLTVKEQKQIKSLKKRINDLEKSIERRQEYIKTSTDADERTEFYLNRDLRTVNKFRSVILELEGEDSFEFRNLESKYNELCFAYEENEIISKISEIQTKLKELNNSYDKLMTDAKEHDLVDVVESYFEKKNAEYKSDIEYYKEQLKFLKSN